MEVKVDNEIYHHRERTDPNGLYHLPSYFSFNLITHCTLETHTYREKRIMRARVCVCPAHPMN